MKTYYLPIFVVALVACGKSKTEVANNAIGKYSGTITRQAATTCAASDCPATQRLDFTVTSGSGDNLTVIPANDTTVTYVAEIDGEDIKWNGSSTGTVDGCTATLTQSATLSTTSSQFTLSAELKPPCNGSGDSSCHCEYTGVMSKD